MKEKSFLKIGQGVQCLSTHETSQYSQQKIHTICISKDVCKISAMAFYQFPYVKKVIFEAGSQCSKICEKAFSQCVFLETIILPQSLQSIEEEAFSFCASLKTIVIPWNVYNIKNKAFHYCISIQEVKILNSQISFFRESFAGCYSIKKFTLGTQEYKTRQIHDRQALYQREHKFQQYNFCRAIDIEKVENGEIKGEKIYFLWSNIGRYYGYGKNLREALNEYRFLCGRNKLRAELGEITPDTEITLEQYRALTYDCKSGAEEFLIAHNIPLDSKMKISDIYQISKGEGKSYLLGKIMEKEQKQMSLEEWLGLDIKEN